MQLDAGTDGIDGGNELVVGQVDAVEVGAGGQHHFGLDGTVDVLCTLDLHPFRVDMGFEQPARDWLAQPELRADGGAGAADLIADDPLPLCDTPGRDLVLDLVGLVN